MKFLRPETLRNAHETFRDGQVSEAVRNVGRSETLMFYMNNGSNRLQKSRSRPHVKIERSAVRKTLIKTNLLNMLKFGCFTIIIGCFTIILINSKVSTEGDLNLSVLPFSARDSFCRLHSLLYFFLPFSVIFA
jgi:hypothetical protein